MRHYLLAVVATTFVLALLLAQVPAGGKLPVETITPEAIARHVAVIAHDSMQGRDTPSRGLMLTAQYVAEQFQKLGLRPAGDGSKNWLQRYPVPASLRLDYPRSRITFAMESTGSTGQAPKRIAGKTVSLDFATDARFDVDTVPQSGGRNNEDFLWTTTVVAGRHTPASIRQADLRGRIVLYIPPAELDSAARQQIVGLLGSPNRVIVLSTEDSAAFAERREAAAKHPPVVVATYLEKPMGVRRWTVNVRSEALEPFLAEAGLDVAEFRAGTLPLIRELPAITVSLEPQVHRDTAAAVNVVAILDGDGPKFKGYDWSGATQYFDRYVLVTAHMDHVGVGRDQADSIRNGADDNASGVAGLLELAKAFSQPGARPRRSIVFLATSGGRKAWWGGAWWLSKNKYFREQVDAVINLDMIGRYAGDSLRVAGLQELDFDIRPEWIAARHPELQLTLIDGGSIFHPRSDHFVFAREAIPSLYFYIGSHDDERLAKDSPAMLDPEQQARILRLVFYIGHQIASAGTQPRWNEIGRRHRFKGFDE